VRLGDRWRSQRGPLAGFRTSTRAHASASWGITLVFDHPTFTSDNLYSHWRARDGNTVRPTRVDLRLWLRAHSAIYVEGEGRRSLAAIAVVQNKVPVHPFCACNVGTRVILRIFNLSVFPCCYKENA
jgi:hypothetical protein